MSGLITITIAKEDIEAIFQFIDEVNDSYAMRTMSEAEEATYNRLLDAVYHPEGEDIATAAYTHGFNDAYGTMDTSIKDIETQEYWDGYAAGKIKAEEEGG